MRLGKREIDAPACPPGRADLIVFDDRLTGFAVRVTRTGAKVFLFQFWADGHSQRLRIGRYDDLTPAQARAIAERCRVAVAAGENPIATRRAASRARQARAVADALTFASLIDRWHAEGLADRRPRYRGEAVRALRVNLPGLLSLPADAIDASAARRPIQAIAKPHPAMARRTLAYARAMYAWGKRQALLKANPFAGVAIEAREVARDRVLNDGELGEVWRAAAALAQPMQAFVRVLLLTLQRLNEVAGMRWDEIAPDGGLWTLPAGRVRNNTGHLVHLAPPVRALLAERPQHPGVPFVFTTTGRTPISGLSKIKRQLDVTIAAERATHAAATGTSVAPMPPWRFHDLRRTGVTALARLGVRQEVADRLLNHLTGKIQGVAAIYQRYDYAPERAHALHVWRSMSCASPRRRCRLRRDPALGRIGRRC